MKVLLDAQAVLDLVGIRNWIAQENPKVAQTVIERIFQGIERLADFPEMGRIGAVENTREWVVPRLPYIVVYEIDISADVLTVAAVFHGAQDRTSG